MLRRIAVSSAISALVIGATPHLVSAQPVLFTGDATVDFAGPDALLVADPAGVDVGVPIQFPAGTISGNDVEDVRLSYDAASDTLYVGFNTYGIAGDVDGDGDAGNTSATLAGIGGADMPDFGGTESFALLIDVDEDGAFDVIAGVSGATDLGGFTVAEFSGSPFAPGFAFGMPLFDHIGAVYGSPDAAGPDIEFTILDFSTLLADQGALDASASFGINAFVGSFGDAGIGEDFTPGVGQVLDICLTPDAPENTCNGFDDDCDGLIDEDVAGIGDACTVGAGACAAPGTLACGDGEVICDGTPGDPEDETCDDVDNDCDGATDEGIAPQPTTCGTGACAANGQITCQDGLLVDDCSPGLADAETCDAVDNDCDGDIDEGIAAQPTSCGAGACAADGQLTCQSGQLVDDCAPGAPDVEACNGADDDCDGATDEDIAAEPTTCGTGACAATGERTCDGGVFVDDCAPGLADAETCDDVDNDCDGATDEDIAPQPTTCGAGACAADGQLSCQGGELVDDCAPGAPGVEVCDGADDDCDGAIDEGIAPQPTTCGAGACAADGQLTCQGGQLVDSCAPGDGGAEACDGVDNDCDGATDEDIAPQPTTCGAGACAADGQLTCQGGQLVDDCAPGTPGDEVCDATDNDCDGAIDEDVADAPSSCGVGACAADGALVCDGGVRVDTCTPGAPGDEICDGVDNDCDGVTDEGIAPERVLCGTGLCTAKGLRSCVGGELVDTCTPGQPVAETCNAMDDDCDGATDEDIAPIPQDCGVGACANTGELTCESGEWIGGCEPGEPGAEECNEIDDDCDGEIDEAVKVYRITNWTGGRYGLMAWHFNDGGIHRWNMDDVLFTVRPDGTATMAGQVSVAIIESGPGDLGEVWDLEMQFVYRGQGDAFGGPKIEDAEYQTPDVTAEWQYWDMVEGSMSRPGSFVKLEQRPRSGNFPFQLGLTANGKDRDLGVALWYYYTRFDDDGRMIASRGDLVAGAHLIEEGCQPEDEICDDEDNDLDGEVDEGFGVGRPCAAGEGACERPGTIVCGPDGGTVCDAEAGEPGEEICNGEDDDCDGEIDEGLGGVEIIECGVGACAARGKQTCYNGEIVSRCTPGAPTDEICNEIDDDCDGEVDEDVGGQTTYAADEYSAGGHAIWMPDFARRGVTRMHLRDDARLTVRDDGTASLTGTAFIFDGPNPAGEEWTVDVNFAYRGQGPDFGGPKIERPAAQPPAITDLWHYYDLTDGTLTRPGSVVTLTQRPADGRFPMQLGDRANGKDDDLGLAVWFFWDRRDADGSGCDGHGDFNLDLDPIDACAPQPEVCNDIDDDLDGAVDEGFGVGEECWVGEGACMADGRTVCGPDGQPVCDAEPLPPAAEVCDAADNDCDGEVDEDIGGIPTMCGTGACGARGEMGCVDGEMVDSCEPGPPGDEECNDLDDDCDGVVDEGTRSYAVSAYAANGHGIIANGFGRNGGGVNFHFRDDATLDIGEDGTATLTGTAYVYAGDAPQGEEWTVDVELTYRGRGPDFGGPKIEQAAIQPPELQAIWDYYDLTAGTLSRPGAIAVLTQRPADGRFPYQMGPAANNKDADFGASVWFSFVREDDDGLRREGVGDFNIDLDFIGDAGCYEAPEICDGEDNDLDGAVDEGFGVGEECWIGEGACMADGRVVCDEYFGSACDAEPGAPSDEVCDGADNDCDGATDEGIAPQPSDCGTGACGAEGEIVCEDGTLVDTCSPGEPADEECNDVDDDCDGETDEGSTIYRANEYAANGHAFDGHDFGPNGGRVRMHFEDDSYLEIRDDGTATLTAQAFVFDGDAPAGEPWDIELDLVYRGRGDAFGGPKLERPAIQPPAVYALWDYFDMVGGTVSRPGSVATLTQRPADGRYPWQQGDAANNKDADYGASMWFEFHRVDDDGFESRGVGDFNLDLILLGEHGCLPEDEVCNDEDDDLDGAIDEGFGVGDACWIGEGECMADGRIVCGPDGGAACDAQPGAPSDEVCDGADNDCDGATDEGIAPEPTWCGVGACMADGERRCVDGELVDSCEPGEPAAETCDETDEDCDGEVDEGTTSRVWDVSHFRGGHAIWLHGFNRDGRVVRMRFRDGATFLWHVDGTARVQGTAYIYDLGGGPGQRGQEWTAEFFLRDRGEGPDFGGPKIERPGVQTPAVTDTWHYWDIIGARLVRPEETVELTQRPVDGSFPFQFGWLANGKTDTTGAAVWFDWHREQADGTVRSGHGDLNVDMSGEAELCEEPPIDPVCENTCRTEGDRHMEDCVNMGFPAENCEALLGDWLDQCIMLQCC